MGLENPQRDEAAARAGGAAPGAPWPGFAAELDAGPFGLEADPPNPPGGGLPPESPAQELAAVRIVRGRAWASLEPAQAVRAALRSLQEGTGATAGTLWLFQPDGALRRVLHQGLPQAYLTAFARAIESPQVQLDLAARPDVVVFAGPQIPIIPPGMLPLHALVEVQAMAILPLRTRNGRAGIAVLGQRAAGAFGRFTLDYLRMLGDVVGGALDHARQFEVLHAAERRVAASHAQLAQMLRHLDAGVAVLDAHDLRVLEHNPGFARLVGSEPGASLAGRPFADLVPGFAGGELEALLAAACRGQGAPSAELTIATGGAPAYWAVTAAPSLEGGRVVLTIHDLSRRRALEEQVRHAQKMEAVGTLAGGIAHEFNNLLTAILGNVSLALLDLPAGHPAVPGLRDSELAAQRAAELTHQLLGFGRRAPLRLRPTDLGDVVAESLALIAHSLDPRIEVERGLAGEAWCVQGDPSQLGQLLVNLCMNARDAMPTGGRLRVTVANRTLAGGAGGPGGRFVCLEVADTGAGMAPEVMARIYEPFFTTKGPDRGTGLGLAVVHGIVEQHGGWIECESAPGRGTTFRVHLPALDADAPGEADDGPARGGGETVLVADDQEAVRGLARTVLERSGFRVLLARDGAEAVEVFRREHERVRVVVLDRTMPRLSGPEALLALRALAPGVGVIMTSGYGADPGDVAADAFLSKPYPPQMLGQAVRRVLDSRR